MNILITGASSGIGLALVERYLEMGNSVMGCARNLSALKEIESRYTGFTPIEIDLTKRELCQYKLSQLNQSFDLIILNAGTCEYVEVDHFDASLFERVFQTNVMAQIYCLESLLPKLKSGSRIALMSSSSTLFPFAKAEAYGASKAAIDYLGRSLAMSLSAKGISVSVIQPGFVDTPLTRKNTFAMPFSMSAEKAAQIIEKKLAKNKPLIRFPSKLIVSLKVLSLLPFTLKKKLLMDS